MEGTLNQRCGRRSILMFEDAAEVQLRSCGVHIRNAIS